jgi:hypothetical protein
LRLYRGLGHWRKRQGNYKQYCCYFVILIFHFVNFLSLFLAFFDLSSLRTHFQPFTEVVRRIRREVTRKNWKADEPRIAQTPRIGKNRTNSGRGFNGARLPRRTPYNGTFDSAHRRHGDSGRGTDQSQL